jgi:AraC-like DNA-binding protein
MSSSPLRSDDVVVIPELHSDSIRSVSRTAKSLMGRKSFRLIHPPPRMVCAGNRATNLSHRPLEGRNLLRLGAAGLIPEILQERGIRADAAFGRTEIQRQRFADPERVVPLNWLARVFKSAAAATAQTEFGLMVGLRAGSRMVGQNRDRTPDDAQVGSALMRVISRPASFPNSLLALSVSGNKCTIECASLPGNLVARDQLADCAMGFAAGVLRVLCGPRWRPAVFRFAYRQPPGPLRHTALLQAPVSFDADVTALEFESAWLDRDAATSRGNLAGDHHERPPRRDLVGQIRAILSSWNAIERPSAPAVAAEMGLKPRTLNRLLSKEGTSFIRLLKDARYKNAQRMLRDPSTPVLSVAWSLGYADASAFSRAFRQWSGMTPTEWRQATE